MLPCGKVRSQADRNPARSLTGGTALATGKLSLTIRMIIINNRAMKSHPPHSLLGDSEAPVREPGASAAGTLAFSVMRLSSHALFVGAREIEIEHNGMLYRLRQTSLGKLILTK